MEIRTSGYKVNDVVGQTNKKTEKPNSPSVDEVNRFHDNDDVDGSAVAHHHTLGSRSTQAAPGNHRHDGVDSAALFNGLAVGGSPDVEKWQNAIAVSENMVGYYFVDAITPLSNQVVFYYTPVLYLSTGIFYEVTLEAEIRGDTQGYCRPYIVYEMVEQEPSLHRPKLPPTWNPTVPAPTFSSPIVETTTLLEINTPYATKIVSRVFVPYKNCAVRFGIAFGYDLPVTSMDVRKFTLKVKDCGVPQSFTGVIDTSGNVPSSYATEQFKDFLWAISQYFRRMGAKIWIKGHWGDYYKQDE